MPTPAAILEGLAEVAQRWRMLATFWHIYYAILVGGLLLGIRPLKPVAGILLAVPLFSVSVLAWLTGNPFNGTLFAIVGVGLVGISLALPRQPIAIGPLWAVVAGGVMFIFGWVYPHFLATASPWAYLYAAPTGLIPCPTLSITIGLAMMIGGLDSRAWSGLLGVAGLFYGAFGAWRLGVTIDLVLLVGSAILLVQTLLPGVAAAAAPPADKPAFKGPERTA